MKALRSTAAAAAIVGVAALAGTAAAAPIVNGGFENPAVPDDARKLCATFDTGGFLALCPAVPGWSGNFVLGTPSGFLTGGPLAAQEGAQFLMLQDGLLASQSITIDQDGLQTLSWFDVGRFAFSNGGSYEVLVDGDVLGSFVVPAIATQQPWQARSLQFDADAGHHELRFRMLVAPNLFSNVFIDDVRLGGPGIGGVPVPAPQTPALLAAGLALLATWRRRPRPAASSPPRPTAP